MALNEGSGRALARRALVAAMSPDEEALATVLTEPTAGAIDWEWLLERAAIHRVAALLAARLRNRPLTVSPPEPILARLDDIREQAAARALASQRTLRELSSDFARAGVPFLLIKGSILAELVYGDPRIRPFYDVDVIVRRAALPAAEALLRSWGYGMKAVWPLFGERSAPAVGARIGEEIAHQFYLGAFHNISYGPERGDERRPVELHWTIVPRGRLRLREEQLWERVTRARVADVDVVTLDPEARLIHLAMHALEGWFHAFKLLHVADVAWTLVRSRPLGDDVWRLAENWGATYHLELALRLVDQLFGVAAARALLDGRRPSASMRAVLGFVTTEQVLVDRNVGRSDPWVRRAAVEFAWGLAVRSLGAKLRFSIGRRLAKARWRTATRRVRSETSLDRSRPDPIG